jgi:beta-galactosidase/beta-glucuronidase
MAAHSTSLIALWALASAGLAARPACGFPPRPTIDLSGAWEFSIDPDDVGVKEQWYRPDRPFEQRVVVPGAWNTQKVEFKTEQELRRYEEKAPQERWAGPQQESEKLFHVYPGPGWYRRAIRAPEAWRDKVIWLRFGGVHRSADVWINGRRVGAHVGYVAPFKYDITPLVDPGKEAVITVRVDARRNRQIDPLMGCMDTCDFLYISWGGIHRSIVLEATADVWIDDVFVVPHVERRVAEVRVTGASSKAAAGRPGLKLLVEIRDQNGQPAASRERPFAAAEGPAQIDLPIAEAKLWSPSQPHLYTAHVSLLDGQTLLDTSSTQFGMRELRAAGGRFLLNGKPVFLRGYGDDCVYPNTIAPPADKEEYRRRFATAKAYGFRIL